jgi:putative ABC transport system permease protein
MLASVGGVTFAVVLMLVEMGFLNGLYDSQSEVVKKINADLLIVHAHKEAVVPKMPFPKKRLAQARAHPDILAAYPVYVEELHALWKNDVDHKDYPILVFGIDPGDPVFLIPEILEQEDGLKVADTALIDSRSKEFFGRLAPGTEAELSNHTIHVIGTFPLGSDFRIDGNVIVSSTTFFKCFDESGPNTSTPTTADPSALTVESKVEFGVLKVRPGADIHKVQRELQQELPDDVRVLTRDEFIDDVKSYWGTSKPVGYVFGLGMFVGFLIGVTICYQILYSDINDRLPQYATLKALGYSNRYLVSVVQGQAFYLSLFGFGPGLLCGFAIYKVLENVSGILMVLTPGRILLVFILTVAMCQVSALIAVRRVLNADPADVF